MRRMNRLLLVAAIISMLIFSVFAEAAVPKTVIDASESVVNIMVEYTDGYSSGSGFVIESTSTRTLIATNHHVIAGDPLSISVWISETEKINAHILSASEQKDLCVLELAYPIPYAALAMKRDGAEKGDAVYAIGFPGAADYLSTTEAHTSDEATITDGIVSAIRQTTATEYGPEIQLLQINAAINPGNSGGPLLNADGFVVGINTYKAGESEGIFGAIAIGELLDYLADNAITIEETSTSENVWIWIAVVVLAALSVAFVILKKKHKSSKRDNTRSAVVETVSLQQFISKREQKLTAEEAVSLLMPVAIELRNLHNDGRPHLEINPKNITIKGDKATLSQPAGNEAARYASGYAAPEIYKGRSNGHLSDIYSFCAVLVYSMTGVAPNNSLTREESGIVGVLPENNMIPNGIAGTIEKGMALSAENRFDSMQSLIYCLAPYNTGVVLKLESEEVTCRPIVANNSQKVLEQVAKETGEHKQKWRRFWMATMIATGAVAVVVCAVLFMLNSEKQKVVVETETKVTYTTDENLQLIENTNVGDIIRFGTYDQDNDISSGKEDIEWIVLAKEDDQILVISKAALDCQPYNSEYANVTWESCSLRAWLNGTFFETAFNEEEQRMVQITDVSADMNPYRGKTDPGNDTRDKVFLLSINEVEKYFSSNSERECIPTEYAVVSGVFVNNNQRNCWWWLRTPGHYQSKAVNISCDGSIQHVANVNTDTYGVRPVIWLKTAP